MAASRGESATGLLEVYYLDGGGEIGRNGPTEVTGTRRGSAGLRLSVLLLLAESTPILLGVHSYLFCTLYTLTRHSRIKISRTQRSESDIICSACELCVKSPYGTSAGCCVPSLRPPDVTMRGRARPACT